MAKICVLLGDQLSLSMSSLQSIDTETDTILMAEVYSEATYVKHHKKKIAFIFSAMRHFKLSLEDAGYNVTYVKYNDADNQQSIFKQLQYLISSSDGSFDEVVIAHPGEYRLWEEVCRWTKELDIEVTVTDDNQFIAEKSDFADWATGRKQLRMEYFYREMRKKTMVLMEDNKPTGDKWNYDSDNRKKLPKNHKTLPPDTFPPDQMTQEVLALVEDEFGDHFGQLDGFHYAVTNEQATEVLNSFIEHRLPLFGDYQDAMAQDEPWLYHSHIGLYLNTGLLDPLYVIKQAEQAYYNGAAPLNSVEGFIRQILGWREYVRGFYWYLMPDYSNENYFNASRKLPAFFWTADTKMNCLKQCINDTRDNAYAHHIQRLMVIGNFSLLTGLDPKWVNEWYLIVYADAYEWVELPNVSGMVLFADGGKLASKPYAASGAYINKMSNYCQHCEYSVKEKVGVQACPFNYLYWHFLIRHKDILANNPRMAMIYRTLGKMDADKIEMMQRDADTFLVRLEENEKV
ncbi:MAG: cryptochrome/photolyase family protein [Pseudomonadota bacterium]